MIELSVEKSGISPWRQPGAEGGVHDARPGRCGVAAGAFGSGKTTLLRARWPGWKTDERTGSPLANRTVYDGNTPRSEIPAEERNLGLVFQSYALVAAHKSVPRQCGLSVEAAQSRRRGDKRAGAACAGSAGAGAPWQPPSAPTLRWPAAAGGHRPAALVYNPPVILLDETKPPTLTPSCAEEARVFLRELIIAGPLGADGHPRSGMKQMPPPIVFCRRNNGAIEQQGTSAGDVRQPGDAVRR